MKFEVVIDEVMWKRFVRKNSALVAATYVDGDQDVSAALLESMVAHVLTKGPSVTAGDNTSTDLALAVGKVAVRRIK